MDDESNSGTSMAAQHAAVPDRATVMFATTQGGTFNTIRVPIIPVACWRLNDPAFAFDSSFVSPNFRDELGILNRVVAANPGCPAALFGHCDPEGDDALNKTLGDRRAIAIYALLTRQPDLWADLYDDPQVGDTWGTHAVQCMLGSVPDGGGTPYYAGPVDGNYGPETTDAVKRYQGDKGLSVDGQAGKQTRKALFAAYMDWLCTPDGGGAPIQMQISDFLGGAGAQPGDLPKMSLQSCGKFNPIVLLPKAEMKGSARGTRHDDDAPNRRVIMFFFQQGNTVDPNAWPCPKAKESNAACAPMFWPDGDDRRQNGDELREYRTTRDTMACRFYERFARRSPCERGLASFSIRVYDMAGTSIADAPFEATIGSRKPAKGTASPEGIVTLHDIVVPSQVSLRWGFKPESGHQPDLVFGLEMFLTKEGLARDDEARQKLNNLGYPKENDLAESVKGFQLDYGHLVDPPLPIDGSLDLDPRTFPLLQDVYEDCAPDIRNTKPT